MNYIKKSAHLIKVAKNDPFELGRLLSLAITTAKYRYLFRCIGKGTVIGPHTEIINASRVNIGKGCWFQDFVYIRAGAEGQVNIGDRVAINSFARIFGHGSVDIGEDTQIGPGTLITTTAHDYSGDMEASFQPVNIGKRVWIGGNAIILPGVTIGDSAVVGAGSVVTRNVPPGAVVVGVPAKVVKWVSDDFRPLNLAEELSDEFSERT